MAGPDRAISVLKLFTLESPAWSVEEAAAMLQVSASSAYRYVAVLTEAGLLADGPDGRYVLGPAMIQYDRQIQLTDPLLRAARPVMADILRFAPPGSTILLCRLFRRTVLCIHQALDPAATTKVSYERGRPMPLLKGATSTIMLACLPTRDLRRLYEADPQAVAAAGLGGSWEAFRAAMTAMRKAGHAVTIAAVDPDCIGIAVPILDPAKRLLGSLSYVIPALEDRSVARLIPLATAGARDIEARLQAGQSAIGQTMAAA